MRALALIAVSIAAATAPAATTGPAEEISVRSAIVTGSVDANESPTTYHVEYGTTGTYGIVTSDRNAGSGREPLSIRVPLSGLTAETEYHYRVVAENSGGVANGADATFRTAARPRAPGGATGTPRPVGATTATLRGTVVPNDSPTRYHFEYGTTLQYGQSTLEGTIAADAGLVRPSAAVGGLSPNTRYHVCLVATNAAGRVAGADRTFLTLRQPTGVSIAVDPSSRLVWGRAFTVTGTVSGQGIEHVPVALERLDFPFGGNFSQVGPTSAADRQGGFSFKVAAAYTATRMRVVTRTRVAAASPPVTLTVAVRVGLRLGRLSHGRVQLSGATWPAVPHGRASLQRRRSGRWVSVARTRLSPLKDNRSRYRFRLRRPRQAQTYRVVVIARDGGAHHPGTSRTRRLSRRTGLPACRPKRSATRSGLPCRAP